ncbi:MAG: hypothetical protein GY837_28745 [Bosea sp.]|uniref:hypothetical protein n=3 Tax=Bosea sp. (in: a-proteobacteria) TaxID=1871050 RepID=UPI0031FE58E8|nr:hypothetical protein [Bosea sp. (in: a-proteobacteria)]
MTPFRLALLSACALVATPTFAQSPEWPFVIDETPLMHAPFATPTNITLDDAISAQGPNIEAVVKKYATSTRRDGPYWLPVWTSSVEEDCKVAGDLDYDASNREAARSRTGLRVAPHIPAKRCREIIAWLNTNILHRNAVEQLRNVDALVISARVPAGPIQPELIADTADSTFFLTRGMCSIQFNGKSTTPPEFMHNKYNYRSDDLNKSDSLTNIFNSCIEQTKKKNRDGVAALIESAKARIKSAPLEISSLEYLRYFRRLPAIKIAAANPQMAGYYKSMNVDIPQIEGSFAQDARELKDYFLVEWFREIKETVRSKEMAIVDKTLAAAAAASNGKPAVSPESDRICNELRANYPQDETLRIDGDGLLKNAIDSGCDKIAATAHAKRLTNIVEKIDVSAVSDRDRVFGVVAPDGSFVPVPLNQLVSASVFQGVCPAFQMEGGGLFSSGKLVMTVQRCERAGKRAPVKFAIETVTRPDGVKVYQIKANGPIPVVDGPAAAIACLSIAPSQRESQAMLAGLEAVFGGGSFARYAAGRDLGRLIRDQGTCTRFVTAITDN